MTPLTKISTSIIVVIVLLFIQLWIETAVACEGIHLEIGAGNNTNLTGNSVKWDNGDGVGSYFGLRYEMKYGLCHWSHYSQWNVGPPSNNRTESSLDHLGCAFRIKLL